MVKQGSRRIVTLADGQRIDVCWVTIEGPIGAGKTELANVLLPHLKTTFGENRVFFLKENIEELMESGLFQDYQRKPKKWCYEFQTACFEIRTRDFLANWPVMLDAVGGSESPCDAVGQPKKVLLLSERCILSDAAFMQVQWLAGNCTERTLRTYMNLNARWRMLYPIEPSLVLYCRAGSDPASIIALCDERIKERGRDSEEELVKPAYNMLVLKRHDEVFGDPDGTAQFSSRLDGRAMLLVVPVVMIDTRENYRDDGRVALKKSQEITNHICKEMLIITDDAHTWVH